MATVVWIGGSHNWSAGAAWVGGVPPTAVDDVLIGTGGGGSTTGTLTIDGTSGTPSLCRSIDCSSFTGTVSMGATAVLNVGDPAGSGAGSFKLVAGMTFNPNTAATINFVSITGTTNITTAGKTLPIVNWNGAGGTWQLQDNYLGATSRNQTLSAGTLSLNTHNFTVDQFVSTTGSTRVLNMSTGTVKCVNGGSGVWNVGNLSTGLTINSGSSSFDFSSAATLNMGDQTYNDITSTFIGSLFPTFAGDFTCHNLTVPQANLFLQGCAFSGNPTINNNLVIHGVNSTTRRSWLKTDDANLQRTVTVNGTVDVTNINITGIKGAGSASWNLSAITGLSGDGTNNSGITFTSPTTCYAKTAISRNWSDAFWFTTSGGSTPNRVPLAQDHAIFDANSITAGSLTISGDANYMLGYVDWTGVTNSPVWAKTSANIIFAMRDIKLSSGMTHTGTVNEWFWIGLENQTITQNGCASVWGNPQKFDAGPGTVTIADNMSCSNTIEFASGILDLNGKTLTGFTTGTIDGATIYVSGQMTSTGAITQSAGTLSLRGAQCQAGSSYTISGGTINYTTVTGSELKTVTSFSMSGGTMKIPKQTVGTTWAQSGGSIIVPPLGTITWGTGSLWTWTPNTFTFTTQGIPTWTGSSLTVAQAGSFTFGG